MKTTSSKADTGREQWARQTLEPALKESPERAVPFTTISGRPINRLYTGQDLVDVDRARSSQAPGSFPYTRGIHASGYRGKLWTMRQFAGFGSPAETNQRYKELLSSRRHRLERGVRSSDAHGRDPDHELSRGEVGKCGVSVVSLADMEALFDGIPLADVTTSMTINSPASIIFAMYLVVAEKQGASWGADFRNAAERHPQGVHRAEGIHLSTPPVDAARH